MIATAHEHLVLDDERDRGAEVLHAGGDRHGHGQDVVDEQRAGDGQPGLGAEVGGGDLVVAAAAGVGVHVLPVGGDDREHQHDDRDRDPGAEVVGRHARDGQDQQHLARRVGHGGQRVGGEDGQRDALGEERLPQPVAAQRPPDQDPFGHVGQFGHAEDRKRSNEPAAAVSI